MLGLRCKDIENLLSLVGRTSSVLQCRLYDVSISRRLQILCVIEICFESMGGYYGTSSFALFRCSRRGGQPHECRRAATAHRPAIAKPTDSRSRIGDRRKATGRKARGIALTAAERVFLDH